MTDLPTRERSTGDVSTGGRVHRFPIRIYFEDTDTAGIVYFANYLKFAERARTEMLRDSGLDHASLMRDTGLVFAVKASSADYHRPARLDDLLTVETRILKVGGASAEMAQDIFRTAPDSDGAEAAPTPIASTWVRVVLLDARGAPARIPPNLRASLQTWGDPGAVSGASARQVDEGG